MFDIKNDNEYFEIVNDILTNEEFNKIDKIEHHGITRFEHSLKVSYYSYVISKKLRLRYREVARAGLLHDFFLSDNNRSSKDRFKDTFTHPKRAFMKSNEFFDINDLEENIIVGHMFPFYKSVPKYIESWIVNITDKVIGGYEFFCQYRFKLNCAANYLYIFVLLNLIK